MTSVELVAFGNWSDMHLGAPCVFADANTIGGLLYAAANIVKMPAPYENAPMDIPTILDSAKTRQQIDSDNRLALALVVSRSMVSDWRNGKRAPDSQNAMRLADMAGLDRLEVLATCELQREKDPKRRQYWATFLPGLRRMAALVTACSAAALSTPQSAEAVGIHSLKVSSQCLHNINSRTNVRRNKSFWSVAFLQRFSFGLLTAT